MESLDMDRFVVMVDAGYLLHQSAEIVSERASTKRHHLEVMNPAALINLLLEKTRTALGLTTRELLRVYWYDGVMASGLSPQQRAIAELPDVHFRSGIVNAAGQQRGVDSLIVTDLIELASNGAISDAALVTGDGDFAIGIEMAQKKGVRIAVIGVEDTELGVSHRQSFEITSRADRVARLNVYDLSAVMRYVPPAAPMMGAAPAYGAPPTPHVASNVPVQPAMFAPLSTAPVQVNDANIGLILDVPLQVTVELGRTKKTIKDILELTNGSIVELDKLAGEPVDIMVNGKFLAKGEVVVIDENFGVRITDIVSPAERAQQLQ